MGETTFQRNVIKTLKELFPGCIITRGNAARTQGIPDLLILWGRHWATLEVKQSATASRQPNQDYYVDLMNEMSYSAFIFPENEEQIYREIQCAFST